MKKIRPLALALIKNENKIFVYKGRDKVKGNEAFYRSLGGGIEFGEDSLTALKREFKEELSAELCNEELVKVFENIFKYQGKDMHEIVFVYKADFVNKEMYKKNNIKIPDAKHAYRAIWEDVELLKKSNFYPEGIKDLL